MFLTVRLQVPTAVCVCVCMYVKMTALRGIASCNLVEVGRRFSSAYCLRHQGCHLNTSTGYDVAFVGRYVAEVLQKYFSRVTIRDTLTSPNNFLEVA